MFGPLYSRCDIIGRGVAHFVSDDPRFGCSAACTRFGRFGTLEYGLEPVIGQSALELYNLI